MDQRSSLGDQNSLGCAGGSPKKRRAAVREEPADKQRYVPWQQSDMVVDMAEKLSFFPTAVKRFGWVARGQVLVRQKVLQGMFQASTREED